MPSAADKANVSLELDIAQVQAALAMLPPEGQKQMKAMVDKVASEYKRMEAAAAKAAANQAKASGSSYKSMADAAKQATALIGGSFGKLGQVAFEFGGKATTALGAFGGAAAIVGGVALAGVAAARGVDALVDSADQAVQRLDKLGRVDALPAGVVDSIRQYQKESKAASVASDELRATVGGLVAGAFEPVIASVAGAVIGLEKLLPAVDDAKRAVNEVVQISRNISDVGTLGALPLARYVLGLDDLDDAGRAAAESLALAEEATKRLNDSLSAGEKIASIQADALLEMTGASDAMKSASKEVDSLDDALNKYVATLDLADPAERALADAASASIEVRKKQVVADAQATDGQKKLTEAMRLQQQAEKEAADEARNAIERTRLVTENEKALITERIRSRDELQNLKDAVHAEQQAEADAAAQQQDTIRGLNDLSAAIVKYQGSWKEKGDMAAGLFGGKAGKALVSEQAGQFVDLFKTIGELSANAHAEQVSQLQDLIGRRRDAIKSQLADEKKRIAAELEAGTLTEEQADREVQGAKDAAKAHRDALNDRTKAERDALMKSFRSDKSLQIAAAAIDAIRAGISLIPSMAFLGPFAPAAAAGIAGSAFALARQQINAQEPPTFERGGSVADRVAGVPDHVLIGSRLDEHVVTGQGVAAAGGHDVLDRLNDGLSIGGAPVVNVYFDRRMVASVTGSNARPDPRRGRRDPNRSS